MPPLAHENPFLSGMKTAVTVARQTTAEQDETLRRAAVANFMQNAGKVAQRINERESALASEHAKRVQSLMKESAVEAGGNGKTSDEMIAKAYNDQLALSMESYAFEAQRAGDAALARNVMTRAPYTLSRMNGNEQEAVKMLLGDDIHGAVSRMSSAFGKSGMPAMPKPGEMYDFKEINSGGRSYIGRVNKLTGKFELQDTLDDPMMQLNMADKMLGLEKTGLDMEKIRHDMSAGATKTIDAGTQRIVEKRAKVPANWNAMTDAQKEAFVAQNAAAMGWENPLTEIDPVSGELILRKYFNDIRPTSGGDGGGFKAKDIAGYLLKRGEHDGTTSQQFGLAKTYQQQAEAVKREMSRAYDIADDTKRTQALRDLSKKYGKDPQVYYNELKTKEQTAWNTGGKAQDQANEVRGVLEMAGVPQQYHDTGWRKSRDATLAKWKALTPDRQSKFRSYWSKMSPQEKQKYGNDIYHYYYAFSQGK
ncbi:MAG: hypothetical protein IH600_16430 [Bacteroidetes bacterium]|nr:hypothetical protein [Bacteroidota bacterium]